MGKKNIIQYKYNRENVWIWQVDNGGSGQDLKPSVLPGFYIPVSMHNSI